MHDYKNGYTTYVRHTLYIYIYIYRPSKHEVPFIQEKLAKQINRNDLQSGAFDHFVEESNRTDNEHQILMYVGGPGGTGKTQNSKSHKIIFHAIHTLQNLRAEAYTTGASMSFGSSTIHSLIGLLVD